MWRARWGVGILVVCAACQASGPPELGRAARPAVGSELAIDDPVVRLHGGSISAAASDGTNFLLVWREDTERLFAGRFDQDGAPLEPIGHGLGVNSINAAQLAARGAGYVLAWTDGSVYASRMNAAGDLVGSPVAVAEPVNGERLFAGPGLAVSSNRILVVWAVSTDGPANPIRGRLFDYSLAPVGPAFAINGLSAGNSPAAASNGSNFFVAWEDYLLDSIRGTRVTSAGVVVDGGGIAISPSTHQVFGGPRVSFGGGQYLVSWRREAISRIYGRRYQPNGVSLDAVPIEFSAGPNDSPLDPGLRTVFDGDRFVISWIDDREGPRRVFATRLGTDGALDPVGGARVDSIAASAPTAIATAGGVTLLARSSSFALTDADGTTLTSEPLPFSFRYNHQTTPSLCATAGGQLAVWQDDRIPSGIHVAPLTASGAPDGPVQRLSSSRAEPVIACGDGVNLVAWRDDSDATVDVLALRLDDDGNPLDGAPIDLGDFPDGPPAIASSGDEFLVVWGNSDVFGRRVAAADGSLPDPGAVPISSASGSQCMPAVAFGDGVYLAAWSDTRDGLASVYGARMDENGEVLDLVGFPIGAALNGYDAPAVAHRAGGFLVVWPSSLRQLSGRVVDPDGIPVAPERLILDAPQGDLVWLDATSDGSSFAVVATHEADLSSKILLTRLDAGGVSLDLTGATIATGGAEPVQHPVVSAGAAGLLVAYERSVIYGGRATPRVRLVGVGLDPPGTACSGPVLCASGFCVDEVCCDVACGGGDPGDCRACSVAAGGAANGTCGPVDSGRVCRPAAGECDLEEVCDGAALECPADDVADEGADCSDGDACTTADACAAGACVGDAVNCSSDDPCQIGSCQAGTGACAFDTVEDGTPCPPPDLCVVSASCLAGACQPGAPVTCPEAPDCQQSDGCDPSSGECGTSPVPDGTACADGICQAGACTAGTPDAGPADAGQPAADAGVPADDDSSGCGCRASGDGGSSALACLTLLLIAFRRRRRVQERDG